MTETISTPGVYTSEVDQSFIAPIQVPDGCAIIGPTSKGQAFVPTSIQSPGEFSAIFGTQTSNTYVPQTVYNYLQAGNSINVTRVLGNGGWAFNSTNKLAALVSGSTILTVFHPTQNTQPTLVNENYVSASGTYNSFNLIISGSQLNTTSASVSLVPANANYVTKVLGTSANYQTGSIFPYLNFSNFQTSASLASVAVSSSLTTGTCTFTSSYAQGYASAASPWIITSTATRLFQFVHRSQGFASNQDVKVVIQNITVNTNPTVYTTFDVIVRQANDTDKTPVILEQYTQVNLNPNDPKYIGLAIGDKYKYFDSNTNKVISQGNFDNISAYIRVSVTTGVANGAINPNVAPNGYEAIYETIAGFSNAYLPTASFVYSNTGSFVYSGFDFSNTDNWNYLNPVPQEATQGRNQPFYLSASDNKFVVPLQGGTDGMSYQTIQKMGADILSTNVFGFDLSSNGTGGYAAFAQAINILSNSQLYNYGILVIPGVLESLHGAVTAYAQTMCETRQDTVYLRDLVGVNDTVPFAITTAAGLNSSYSATYYPWVKVTDIGSSKKIYVPPTVLVPQAVAYNDKIGASWFAVAGTGRGTLGGAIDTKNRLTKVEQGQLYNASINPIIKTPNTGVVIWGQKTLLQQNTALNRLNVRRLLITLKNYISTIANDLVFEQNINTTRNAFLNKINPYLSNVQQNQGITAYKTTCDASNNSNTDIANHILNCKIQIIPTESIEFILLEFDISSQGATFN